MKIQLTISLLVSDRMETLGRCLASLKPLLRELDSELIIVYTGKSPDTLELAKEYTSHIIPFTWCNDFSKARNAGLKKAKGEWFLYLDDDEWFEDTAEIISFFKSGEYQKYQSADYIQRNYLDWEGSSWSDAYVGRMCRRTAETRFVYPIHENLKPYPEPCKKLDTFVHHFGYVGAKNDKTQAEKSDRNLSLLLGRMKTEKPSSHLYAQLAQEYASVGKYDEAIDYCRRGLTLAEKETGQNSLKMWLQLELPRELSCAGDFKSALAEGEAMLASSELEEVGEINLAVRLVNVCWSLKDYKKGLKYVRYFQERLKYLQKHPEKAMAQNGITATFSGAELQAADVYIKGLFFASETGDDRAIEEMLTWLPWEDSAHLSARYADLEGWKKRYGEHEEAILKAYHGLAADNVYVCLQKAYYEEKYGQEEKVPGYWEACAKNCPPGFEEQLIRMAVRNGFSPEHIYKKMPLEDWNECARMLAENTARRDGEEFLKKLLEILEERPLFAERLTQAFLEKELTRGMLEPAYLAELLAGYCESVTADAKMLYRKEILEDSDSYMLPAKYKFAVRIKEALELIENGKITECVPLLAEALHICPQMSGAVSHLTRYLNELIKNPPQPVSEEFLSLGGQVKQMLYGLMDNKQWNEAYGVSMQLVSLLPEDLEVLRLKQEILKLGT